MSSSPFQSLDQLEEALDQEEIDPVRHETLLSRLRGHIMKYADLERRLLGAISVPIPTHLLGRELPEDPVQAAEDVARKERVRLELGDEEAGDLASLLDHQGLKVYRPPMPKDSPLEGLFLFDAEVGPVFVVRSDLDLLSGDFVLARLYGHYLMDHDPYMIHLAWGQETSPDITDLRAHAFAAAFLVSEEGLHRYLSALGHLPGQTVTAEEVTQLAMFFEVGYRPLISRLVLLEHLGPDDVPELLGALPSPAVLGDRKTEPGAVSERYMRLALEAHATGILSSEDLAVYLETDEVSTRALSARFSPEENS